MIASEPLSVGSITPSVGHQCPSDRLHCAVASAHLRRLASKVLNRSGNASHRRVAELEPGELPRTGPRSATHRGAPHGDAL